MSAITWFLLGAAIGALWLRFLQLVAELRTPTRVEQPATQPATLVPSPAPERRRMAAQLLAGGAFECGCASCRAWRRGGFVQ